MIDSLQAVFSVVEFGYLVLAIALGAGVLAFCIMLFKATKR